jgi:hypothetical protein
MTEAIELTSVLFNTIKNIFILYISVAILHIVGSGPVAITVHVGDNFDCQILCHPCTLYNNMALA